MARRALNRRERPRFPSFQVRCRSDNPADHPYTRMNCQLIAGCHATPCRRLPQCPTHRRPASPTKGSTVKQATASSKPRRNRIGTSRLRSYNFVFCSVGAARSMPIAGRLRPEIVSEGLQDWASPGWVTGKANFFSKGKWWCSADQGSNSPSEQVGTAGGAYPVSAENVRFIW